MCSAPSTGTATIFGSALVLMLLVSCTSWDAAKTHDKGLALVIGNARYDQVPGFKTTDLDLPTPELNLATPAKDAEEITRKLRKLKFEVIMKINLTKDEMESTVHEFLQKVQGKDYRPALIYYSGHGIQVQGETYLWPVDGNPRKPETLYSLPFLVTRMSVAIRQPAPSPTEGGIVILDACRNELDGNKGLAKPIPQKGVLIAYAAQPGTTAPALPSERGLSLYTDALLQELSIPGKTVKQILDAVAARLTQPPYHSQSGPLQFKFDPIHRTPRPPAPA